MQAPTWLRRLLDEQTIPWSLVNSRKGQQLIEELRELSLVQVCINGKQRQIKALNQIGLERWIAANYSPPYEGEAPLAHRAQAIVQHGRSKAGRASHATQPILLRWFDPNPATLWATLTRENGVIGVTSDRFTNLVFPRQYWMLTIENWESFTEIQYINPSIPVMVCYLNGQVSDVVVQAFKALTTPPISALHFGDYDWTGLAIYRRLKNAIPGLKLYIPINLPHLFSSYGSRGLLEGQLCLSVNTNDDDRCQTIIRMIEEYNCGIEQEIVPFPTLSEFD